MTDIVIVHSKYGDASNHWYDWLANNLTLEGYDVTLFNLPYEKDSKIEKWVSEMKQQIQINKYETYFVTHGFGTLASLKFIEEVDVDYIEGFFSISGFMEDAQVPNELVQTESFQVDYEQVKSKVESFYGLCAKDDKCISYEETKRLMDTLGGKCKVTEYGGHFMEDDGFTTFTRLQSKMQGIMSQ